VAQALLSVHLLRASKFDPARPGSAGFQPTFFSNITQLHHTTANPAQLKSHQWLTAESARIRGNFFATSLVSNGRNSLTGSVEVPP
jgi:hypothetical protein